MEPSFSFVEYHEFLDVLLQPFHSFKQKAECHVNKRARRYFRKRFGDGEAETFEFHDGEVETYEFGVEQHLEYEEEFSAIFERFQQSGECQSGTRRCFNQRLETDAGHEPKSSSEYCQARQQEDTQNADTWKQEKRSGSWDSNSVWKQMRGVETHMNRSKMAFRYMQISNHQYLGKVFQNLQKKLGTT